MVDWKPLKTCWSYGLKTLVRPQLGRTTKFRVLVETEKGKTVGKQNYHVTVTTVCDKQIGRTTNFLASSK